ncbi:hypothetical protein PENSPDRAFT_752823 [Peniophora sp. CONT]|nr:hypothetical protein PENSPDRAFT_752823 [Peniophora sp. CONT]
MTSSNRPIPKSFYERVTRPDGDALLARALDEWTAAYILPHSSGDPLQDAISDRLERLFPDDFTSALDKVAVWVDLPPKVLYPGELNLLHQPSIFASPSYDPSVSVWAQLAYSSVLARILAFLHERKVPPAQMDPRQVNVAAAMTAFNFPLKPRERGTSAANYCASDFLLHHDVKDMPRSLFTSPKRNAGVLFRRDDSVNLGQATFGSAEEGRVYFESRLARLPPSSTRACMRTGPVSSLYISVAHRTAYNEIPWDGLSDGTHYVWCTRPQDERQVVSLFQSVQRRLSEVYGSLETCGMWHANCAPVECRWQQHTATREHQFELSRTPGSRRREQIYNLEFRDALRQALSPEHPMPPSTMRWARRQAMSVMPSGRMIYADWRAALAQHFGTGLPR